MFFCFTFNNKKLNSLVKFRNFTSKSLYEDFSHELGRHYHSVAGYSGDHE